MKLMHELKKSGVFAVLKTKSGVKLPADTLTISMHGKKLYFKLIRRLRAPYASEVSQLDKVKHKSSQLRIPLLVAPIISQVLGQRLTQLGWSWADERGSYDLRSENVVLRQTVTVEQPISRQRTGIPQGPGSLTMVRWLLHASSTALPIAATDLAKIARVSQAAASQLLTALSDIGAVKRQGRHAWLPRRNNLLDQFLATYAGPRGTEQYFYTLSGLNNATKAIVARAASHKINAAVSADVGPDILAAWRVPTVAIIYMTAPMDMRGLQLVEAQERADGNIIIRQPYDTSIFTAQHMPQHSDLPLTDVSQMLWDLHNLGGSDREEAADKLHQWYLNR